MSLINQNTVDATGSNTLLVSAAWSTWLCPMGFLPLSALENPSLLKHRRVSNDTGDLCVGNQHVLNSFDGAFKATQLVYKCQDMSYVPWTILIALKSSLRSIFSLKAARKIMFVVVILHTSSQEGKKKDSKESLSQPQ